MALKRQSKSYVSAWTAHDIALKALTTFADHLHLANGTKLSRPDALVLTRLSAAYDIAAERIRILRGKPLPGVVRPKAKSTKPQRAREVDALPTPSVAEPAEVARALSADALVHRTQ